MAEGFKEGVKTNDNKPEVGATPDDVNKVAEQFSKSRLIRDEYSQNFGDIELKFMKELDIVFSDKIVSPEVASNIIRDLGNYPNVPKENRDKYIKELNDGKISPSYILENLKAENKIRDTSSYPYVPKESREEYIKMLDEGQTSPINILDELEAENIVRYRQKTPK